MKTPPAFFWPPNFLYILSLTGHATYHCTQIGSDLNPAYILSSETYIDRRERKKEGERGEEILGIDRDMGSSNVPAFASMAALLFGFSLLSLLPEVAVGITRQYTFNVE